LPPILEVPTTPHNIGPTRTEKHSAVQVRRDFLDFFAARGHREVPSGPIYPSDDPTLLFTNAGMNQFKDVFLGTGSREYSRATDTQKCLRVSGKHNDLEEVGRDTYHHTFFEMLGNWSFGDYFKRDAILWAWELLTDVWQLPHERLWITVFEGDEGDGLAADEEAERIWIEEAGVSPQRVLRASKADNFWEMGASGPCGPCTEIHIDRGGPGSDPEDGADPKIGVNAGNERFIELWNLVFISFNRMDDGSLKNLPAKHVDTGMGFERILSVLQKKSSNYDTDLFQPIFDSIGALTGRTYGGDDETQNVAFRVIADHVRAVTCAVADGVQPSNTGRGYVLRRLIRRAARFGRQALGCEEPFLFEVAHSVSAVLGAAFPEIESQLDSVQAILKEEEISFGRTLGRGLLEFEKLSSLVEQEGSASLPGAAAFELYATYGFPKDLVAQMAEERGLSLDQDGWTKSEEAHREASKSEDSFKQLLSGQEAEGLAETCLTCHDQEGQSTLGQGLVLAFFPGGPGQPDRLVLDSSPFYAEAGGQCGDGGRIEGQGVSMQVTGARQVGSVLVHIGEAKGTFEVGSKVRLIVDPGARAATCRNHTATHLLHQALKTVLGEHVNQRGSGVDPERLRFDFSHPSAVTAEELDTVECLVNRHITANSPVDTTVEDLESAQARGVTALFGEKYTDRVRVVDVGGWSTELCGGTHVAAAGEIGPFLILSERAISAGVRRIEALSGAAAVLEIQNQRRLLREAAGLIKVQPEEVPARIAALQDKLKQARKLEKAAAGGDVAASFEALKGALEEVHGISTAVFDASELTGKPLDELADRVASLGGSMAVVLVGREGPRVPFQVLCSGKARDQGLAAGSLAKAFGGQLKGGGGGRPDRAQGQGTSVDLVPPALAWAREELARRLTE
jgi:alanyl-tRNA synthetase